MRVPLLALAALPLYSQILLLEPVSFTVSPGERVGVVFRTEGAETPSPEALRNATIFTETAAFNITGLRQEDGAVAGSAPVKAPGTLVLHASFARGGCVFSAKALVVSEKPGGRFDRRATNHIELVPGEDPYLLKPGQVLRANLLVGGKVHSVVEHTLKPGRQTVEARAGCSSATLTFELP
jgi:hypothetical protein